MVTGETEQGCSAIGGHLLVYLLKLYSFPHDTCYTIFVSEFFKVSLRNNGRFPTKNKRVVFVFHY